MGQLKVIVIVMGIITAGFVVAIAASSITEASKYGGLTEEQISRVKIIKETCDSQIAMSFAAAMSDERRRLLEEKCEEIEAKKIGEYRQQNQ